MLIAQRSVFSVQPANLKLHMVEYKNCEFFEMNFKRKKWFSYIQVLAKIKLS